MRAVLYMGRLTAVRSNPTLKALYEPLLGQGKAKKGAFVGCMHKLLRILNATMSDRQPWQTQSNLATETIHAKDLH
ncbi:MAG: hypothetical protein IGR76_13140 [Synechococcales cyanobacterium T60_A2020_003]|nr:hypothetical protein [Synechococcales cyanobacterium T60_A2020_003]